MRDLEEKIAQWRKRMAAGGVKTSAVLDELESHLRDEFQARILAGDSESVAFETATARIGSAGSLKMEFNKISGAVSLPVLISASLWIGAMMLMLVLSSGRLASGKMNPLFFAHALTLLAGYLAAFLAGFLAICYVCCRWAGGLSPAREQALNRAVPRFTYVAAAGVAAGLLLGMVWSHENRGGAWQNDPREIGGLCVCVWLTVLCLLHSFGKMGDHTRMVLSIIGNMIVAQAWFGAGILAHYPAMRWYGVMNYLPLQLFMGAHLLFLLMAFSRKLETAET
jgi:hypothetical protein